MQTAIEDHAYDAVTQTDTNHLTHKKLPKCSECGNSVNMTKGLQLGDNEWIHEKCYDILLYKLTHL